jgi:hypothetical protein
MPPGRNVRLPPSRARRRRDESWRETLCSQRSLISNSPRPLDSAARLPLPFPLSQANTSSTSCWRPSLAPTQHVASLPEPGRLRRPVSGLHDIGLPARPAGARPRLLRLVCRRRRLLGCLWWLRRWRGRQREHGLDGRRGDRQRPAPGRGEMVGGVRHERLRGRAPVARRCVSGSVTGLESREQGC